MRRGEGPMRGLVLGQLRQVHQHRLGRAEHDGLRQRRGPRRAGRQVVGLPVLADRLDAARVGIGDGDEPQRDGAAVMASVTTSAGSSASRDGGSRKTALSRPVQASISARRQRRSASSGGTAMGKDSEAIRVVSTVMRRASTCAAS